MEIKMCTICKLEKPISEFYHKKGGKFGVMARCKECESTSHKKYYTNNRDIVLNNVKERSKGHKEAKALYDKDYHAIHILKRVRQSEEARLKRDYNITMDQYFDMLFKQNFKCLGCGKHQSDIEWALCVDHDHKCCSGDKSCGKCIRGLLCCSCNHAIGSAYDDPQILKHLVVYLESFNLNETKVA